MNKLPIDSPADIKGKSIPELNKTASDIREFLINSVSKTGGHLGSNLGIVELTMALHYCFDSPKDKLIFDVGHQGYVHKILTGRSDKFDTLRQYQGLSGFLKMAESEHDVWEAGHSSTSISAACGFAFERDNQGADNHVVAIIGDGSLTNGMSLEALNHIVELNQKVIIIINDNEMSISSNVGFIDNILKDLQTSLKYENTKLRVHQSLDKYPGGKTVAKALQVSKKKLKNEINSAQSFFNLMGFKYFGPVNGHDFKDLIKSLEEAKKYNGPVIVHVKTEKGKGYKPAEEKQWHGVAPFNVETGELLNPKTKISYSGLVAGSVNRLMDQDEDIVVITPAMLDGSELKLIQEKYPKRVTDVGIAEEHAITFAGAAALAGAKPFVSIYSTFLQRSYDQVFHDLVRQNANVVIGIDRAGLVGDDGETHQGIYDVSFLSHMPNIKIAMGKDALETRSLLSFGFKYNGTFALRYPRGGAFENNIYEEELLNINDFSWPIETKGSKTSVIAYGPVVEELHNIYKDDDEIEVINARFIKPLDEEILLSIKKKNILVVEEQQRLGGLNNLILDFYNQHKIAKVVHTCAFNDKFVMQGNVELLKAENNMTTEQIVEQIREINNG